MSSAVDPLFGLIQISSSIKIKRSDGRIHLAKVVQLSSESKSVGVEWNEHGEVKGKEILLDLVFELNNELRPNTTFKQPTSVINQQIRPTAAIPMPSNGLSSSRLTLDIDTLEREYNSRPPPTLPPQLLQRMQQHPVSIQTTSTPLPPPSFNGSVSATTAHQKTSYAPSGTSNTGAVRSIRRPTAQTNSSSSKISSSPVPPPTPIVEQQIQPQLQIPLPANNKIERRLSRLHVVQQSSSINAHNTAVSVVPEPTSFIGLHGPFGQMILDYRSTLTYSPMTNSNLHHYEFNQKDLRICVAVRKRPLNKRELAKKDNDVITIPNRDHCLVHVPKSKVDLTKYLDNQTFKFDYTFDEKASTELVYHYTAAPLIDTIFNGGNATVFAYGQTGSGKTFTMGGDLSSAKTDYSHGVYAQTARDIFHRLSQPQYRSSIEIFVTFYEIYCGKVFDLLNNKKRLRVLEDQKGLVQVCDRKEQQVKSVQDVLNIIQNGMSIRTSGTTAANSNSSRSHAVLQIILKSSTPISIHSNVSSSSARYNNNNNNNHNNPAVPRRLMKEIGKMSLIDLAGSERGKDTASGDRLQRMEGSEINKSLLALKECIRALGRGDGSHVPFRGSTLTKVLRDSFIGEKSKVCMIAMVSPTHSDVENTMNTLRYADRVKELRAGDRDGIISNEDDDIKMDGISKALPIDEDKENQHRHHHRHQHYPRHHDGSASSTDSATASSNDDDDDNEQDEALASYAAQVEHLQEYEEALFDCCQDVLTNKEAILTKQLRAIVKQAQDTVDYDQEKFVNDIRANLFQRQQILTELQTRLQAFADCLQQEEQVAAAQRIKKQQSSDFAH
ncbi:unnamed protein product [Rotaria magnacalcarata]|uniref:Kinesin-like protein n=6 Tax=Rotaria magnacalcarata TaxID=392030 RepID=A0A815ZSP6_9BILA|nr:unnamed protein product [Rotaria magnacalcarata]CAF1662140.1 unnamed protein product [Rotaria magnacalcarata]CAF3945984.1 unnamed protein product [Rotaria magnacalcarata]CAF3954019.1 unnamed protein product [Rotaria magnacalcarata]